MRYHQRGHIGFDGPGSDEDFSLVDAIPVLLVIAILGVVVWTILL